VLPTHGDENCIEDIFRDLSTVQMLHLYG